MKFRLDPFAPSGVSLDNSTTYVGGGRSGINSIVAGTNITVNNADPLNPIVSSTGGGGGGVSSISKSGDTQLTGDVTLSEGSNITLTQVGNDIEIASSGGGGTPGGSDTYVQFNDGGAFGGEDGLVYDKTTNSLKVNGGTGTGVTLEVGGTADMYYLTMQGATTLDNNRNATLNSINVDGVASIDSSGNISGANLSGTNTGDQTNITGNAGTATALATPRTIGTATGDVISAGSSFNGTANNTNAYTLATVNSNVGSFTNASVTVNGKGLITAASSGAAPVTSVTGTTNRITVTGTTTPSVDIAATYVGQSSITTLGTITTGVWNGTTIAVANGGTGQTSYTNGQLLIGNTTGNTLTKATLTAGSGVSITNGTGSITIASSGGGITWTEVTGTSQAAAVDSGYITNNAGLVTVTIPTTAAVGSIVRVVGKGAGGWRVAQNASEIIHFGVLNTTTGTGGRLDSFNRYDSVELVCVTADTEWVIISSQGNITVV